MKKKIFPEDYRPKLDFFETEIAIKLVKDTFERKLAEELNLLRVSAPRFLKVGKGLQDDLAGTQDAMRFIAEELSKNTYVNVMDQYHPCFKANDHPPLDRRIAGDEFERAVKTAREFGIERLDGPRGFRFL